MENNIERYINAIPKAELHVHIEGTFEPELMFSLARKNKTSLPYASIEHVKQAYKFNNLQEFLDIYYVGTNALQTSEDFYALTFAYLQKAHEQNVHHTEVFFDPQAHTARDISFATVIHGIHQALLNAEKNLGISSKLIMCFLRHLDENDALRTLQEALPYKKLITAVGLDSTEVGNPPTKFQNVFAKARQAGFLTVAHAGEEGGSEYVWQAMDLLKTARIDHGNTSIHDKNLLAELKARQIPLTMCPLSNHKLKVAPKLEQHPLKKMLDHNLLVTVNSDDPAYFGGYINENYIAIQQALNLSKRDIFQLAANSFKASFLDDAQKQTLLRKLQNFSHFIYD